MAITCEDNKIEMPCGDCLPSPPDKPLPFVFPLLNKTVVTFPSLFFTHGTNPGKVGLSSGIFLPNYSTLTRTGVNFGQALPITIDPPPGFPGPGLVQATATMTVNSVGDITITMTNNGAGYLTGPNLTGVNATYNNYFQVINVKVDAATDLGAPTALLANPLPFYPNLTLSTCKIIPQLCGWLENTMIGGTPITVNGKWYKNGIQIGSTQSKVISLEGKHKWVHYCPPISFNTTDKLSYQLICADTELVNFAGNVLYYIQYT